MEIGYHASHEQFAPSALLEYVAQAEAVGFSHAMCSDHFHPFSDVQGQSGFAWAWLGAAMQATTSRLSFGTVTAPGQRYHPAIVAQAAATLAEMFPGRFWLALGSGQFLNEHITGEAWPSKDARHARLLECVSVIRDLWAGETVTHRGLVNVVDAKLYSRPAKPPPIFGAAITVETARWVAQWADGLITIAQPHEQLRRVTEAFREVAGKSKPMYLQAQLAYAATRNEALQAAREQWGSAIFASDMLAELRTPQQFAQAQTFVRPEDVDGPVRVSHELSQHRDWLRRDAELGFARVYLHNVTRDQRTFLDVFGEHVLPAMMTPAGSSAGELDAASSR